MRKEAHGSMNNDTATSSQQQQQLSLYLQSIPEYHDPDRIRALYASFPADKIVNKTAYESRLSVWKRILLNSTIQGYLSEDRLSLHSKNLNVKFKKNGAIPLGLQTVIVSVS